MMQKRVKNRSAKSGQYVSSEEAKANPDSTVAETEGLTKLGRAVVEAAKARYLHRQVRSFVSSDPFETWSNRYDKLDAALDDAVSALVEAQPCGNG